MFAQLQTSLDVDFRLSVMEVNSLSLHISMFTACGVWPPAKWTSMGKRILYNSYSCLIVALVSFNCVLLSIDAFTSKGVISDLVETLYIIAAGWNLSYKAFNISTRREDIMNLLALPSSHLSRIVSHEEEALRTKCHRRIRTSTIVLCACLEITVVNMIVTSVFVNIPERTLPIKLWLPRNLTEEYQYWILYSVQIVAFTYAGTFHVFYDTFIIGIMITLCGHLQILQYRNSKVSGADGELESNPIGGGNCGSVKSESEKKSLIQIIKHYQLLLQFAKSFNEIIFYVILVQYLISCFIVCSSVYRLVSMSFSDPAYVFTIFYCATIIIQTFSYCWYGNEVILESTNMSDSLYNSKWYSLELTTLRDFLMIHHRMQTHIEFSCTQLFVLSVDSFKNIMKLTYSGLNLLMQSS